MSKKIYGVTVGTNMNPEKIGESVFNASYNLKAEKISDGVVEISLIASEYEIPELPKNGVEQVGSTLVIVSGVTATQNNTTLSIE